MTVPLQLTAGTATDTAELWVLRDNAVEQLDALVRDSDDRLTQRLMFAVATDPKGNADRRAPHAAVEACTAAAARSRTPSAFKPFWKLPNLFLPLGKRLHPTLRRDAVRKLLADDPDQVVWLYPDGTTGFTPESVPDAAFRSLEDWVDYIIESEQKPLAAWIEATRFDFDHFVCKEAGGPKTKPDKGDKESEGGRTTTSRAPKGVGRGERRSRRENPPAARPLHGGVPPAARKRCRNPASGRSARGNWKANSSRSKVRSMRRSARRCGRNWPPLTPATKKPMDAAICWLNAMWDADPMPAEWLGAWVRSEIPQAGSTIKADEFDKLLHHHRRRTGGSPASGRGLPLAGGAEPGSGVAAHAAPRRSRIPRVPRRPDCPCARSGWRATGSRNSSGADVLGLARVRDRLLQRLLRPGPAGRTRPAGLPPLPGIKGLRTNAGHPERLDEIPRDRAAVDR